MSVDLHWGPKLIIISLHISYVGIHKFKYLLV